MQTVFSHQFFYLLVDGGQRIPRVDVPICCNIPVNHEKHNLLTRMELFQDAAERILVRRSLHDKQNNVLAVFAMENRLSCASERSGDLICIRLLIQFFLLTAQKDGAQIHISQIVVLLDVRRKSPLSSEIRQTRRESS